MVINMKNNLCSLPLYVPELQLTVPSVPIRISLPLCVYYMDRCNIIILWTICTNIKRRSDFIIKMHACRSGRYQIRSHDRSPCTIQNRIIFYGWIDDKNKITTITPYNTVWTSYFVFVWRSLFWSWRDTYR